MKRALLAGALLAGCSTAPLPPAAGLSGRILSGGTPLFEVFIWIKSGLPAGTYPIPDSPALLDQRNYQFEPHVFGIRTGQKLRIRSSDYSPHNVNAVCFKNEGFNTTLLHEEETIRVFDRAEAMVQIRCDLHPNMLSYVGVVDHPFFAVTDRQGRFAMPDLPPGVYELEAWDELLGRRTFKITSPSSGEWVLR